MNPYSRLFSRHIGFHLLGADKDATGGAGKGTLKDQLESANGKVTELEGDKSKLSVDLDAEKSKVTKLEGEKAQLEKEVEASKAKVTKLEGEKTQLSTDLKAANDKITTLEGDARTADERATEKAAANGHKPTQVDPERVAAGSQDGAALYAQYDKLSGREKTAFFRENEKALMAYAAQLKSAK